MAEAEDTHEALTRRGTAEWLKHDGDLDAWKEVVKRFRREDGGTACRRFSNLAEKMKPIPRHKRASVT